MFLQEIYEVLDCMWYDKGTDTDHNTWADDYNRATFNRDANGTTVTNTASNYTYIVANKTGTPSTDYDYDTPLRIEFNMTNNNPNIDAILQIYDANNNYFSQNFSASLNGHWIINIGENQVTWSIDGVDKTPKTVSIGKCYVRIQVPVGCDFTFHDFKIYPI